MKKVSNEFINLSKKIKTQDLKLTINDGELTVQEVHFMPVNIFNSIPVSRLRARKEVIAKELKYSFEGQLFKTIMQQIEITVKNASAIKGKNINFQYGILVDNEFEYVDMGEYYIKDVEDNKKKEELVVTGYDKMLNFMIPFKQSDLKLIYPCKMGQLVSRMGEVCGVELYSTDFYNSDLIVDEDFFTIQELTYRDVLEKVAQTTLTTIFIKENKLYLCKIGESVQTLDTSFLSDLVVGDKFGPINALVLGRGSVEDNIESIDQQSINSNGRCEIRFDENEFIDNKREQVIDGMLEKINGLEYYAVEASNLGVLWLDPCDVITVKDREESEYKTIYLKANVTINTGIKGEMESSIPETTNTEYKVTSKEEKKTLKVERLAKKNEGLIQDLIQETSENSEKLTKHEQTIDSMKDTLKSQETKIETVETKADNAQSTADTATTKAENAQKTADANTTKITTNTTKIAEVEKTVDGITQSVSAVEEKVETVETKANNAQTSANTANTNAQKAQTTADNINTNLTTNYYNKTETENKITQTAESTISEVSKTYSTKTETATAKNEAINSANSSTDTKLKNYTVTSKLGTFFEQNYEHIKVAWNQISEFIQMMIINNNASLAILDENKNVMMALDKKGQHFYKSDGTTVFGEMGVQTVDDNNYIAFSVEGEYDNSISDGMAWGIKTKSDNKFHPLLYIKNFAMPPKNSGGTTGELELSGCNLVLSGEGAGITAGGIVINPDPTGTGLYFNDVSGGNLLSIIPENVLGEIYISFLDNITFYKNQAGSKSFKIGNGENNRCLFTDDGSIYGNLLGLGSNVYLDEDGSFTGDITFYSIPTYQGNKIVYGQSGHKYFLNWTGSQLQFWVDVTNVGTLSDKRLKTEIQDIDDDFIRAIEEIEMKQFKVANRNGLISFGILAQDLIEIFKKYGKKPFDYEIVYETQYRTDDDTIYYAINYEQFLILKQKATDKKIEQLQEKNKQKDEIIENLIKRIETLEKEVNK